MSAAVAALRASPRTVSEDCREWNVANDRVVDARVEKPPCDQRWLEQSLLERLNVPDSAHGDVVVASVHS